MKQRRQSGLQENDFYGPWPGEEAHAAPFFVVSIIIINLQFVVVCLLCESLWTLPGSGGSYMYRNRRKLLFNLVFGPRQVKNLLAAYVAEVGTVLSPLHIHQLKYHKKGAPGRRRRKQCDVCRDGMSTRPVYNCKDCNFNLRATGLTQWGGTRGARVGPLGPAIPTHSPFANTFKI